MDGWPGHLRLSLFTIYSKLWSNTNSKIKHMHFIQNSHFASCCTVFACLRLKTFLQPQSCLYTPSRLTGFRVKWLGQQHDLTAVLLKLPELRWVFVWFWVLCKHPEQTFEFNSNGRASQSFPQWHPELWQTLADHKHLKAGCSVPAGLFSSLFTGRLIIKVLKIFNGVGLGGKQRGVGLIS